MHVGNGFHALTSDRPHRAALLKIALTLPEHDLPPALPGVRHGGDIIGVQFAGGCGP